MKDQEEISNAFVYHMWIQGCQKKQGLCNTQTLFYNTTQHQKELTPLGATADSRSGTGNTQYKPGISFGDMQLKMARKQIKIHHNYGWHTWNWHSRQLKEFSVVKLTHRESIK